jgi:CheY-like chemotaxis protein
MANPAEYVSSDSASQELSSEYHALLESIKKRMDPKSNPVLLVDDERAIRKRVARDVMTTGRNVTIYEAENGKDALEKLSKIRQNHKRDPLFIVLDLNMPVMNGWEVIEFLRKEYQASGETQGIPIIVLSSTSGEKGSLPFFKKSVHDDKSGYSPLVTVAKEACVNAAKYNAQGEEGLMAWIKYFMKAGKRAGA